MEDGIGVNSPEFLQKKIERLKTALDEANVLMDRQVTERDDARAQLDGVRQENQELKRQLEELQSAGTGVAAVANAPAEPTVPAAIDPALEQSLRDRIAQLETERANAQPDQPDQPDQPAADAGLRDRVDGLQRELD